MHLDSEDLAGARSTGGVGRHEDNILTGVDKTLLNTSGKHITNTLDLVDAGDRAAHRGGGVPGRRPGHVVEAVKHSLDSHLANIRDIDLDTLPPGHVLGILEQVVSHPAGDGDDRDGLGNEVLLPADTDKHRPHLVTDLVVALLLVSGSVAIHLVDTNDKLLHTEQVDDTGVLPGLALDLSGLGITLLDGSGEVTVSGNHEKGNVSLGSARDHVLDEIPVARGIDDGVVPLVGEELLGGASDGHTTLALLLLPVHVEGKGERGLAKVGSLLLQLLKLTLRDTSELEQKTSGGGRLSGVDVTTDHNGHMLLLSHGA
mmetsp:Transcript_4580/g.7395  ORF Transcript_4580/g.7395 Transcript_4580/m.7395 type:complete len:315 (+) Transcript_4580:561-1505(+)